MLESVGRNQFVETADRVGRFVQLAEAMFGSDFPCARCADEDRVRVVRDRLACNRRQSRVVGEPPQQSVGIEQISHRPSHASSSLSGSGSKNSSPMRPARRPGRRAEVAGAKGISRAYGFPALARMISCPAWACSSNREKCVLASWTLTTTGIGHSV
ncbi:hypothetical protein ebA3897 [Aromatoleum aromaticum EbN1]|uniref:Uncharacterized protein n=1 Tax=Aromatoleum aromaticum (strain DSM 19018 / LMG 30748 / EbN1) TaxID=76114 RepID=Q5P2X7_AROAE|nr:hypothetical protein ebA3897 [Aromatoleum aromaticum EbN1]